MPFFHSPRTKVLKRRSEVYHALSIPRLEYLLGGSPEGDPFWQTKPPALTPQAVGTTMGRRSQRPAAVAVSDTRDIGTLLQQQPQHKMVTAKNKEVSPHHWGRVK
ncbi:Hypothetical predicted protein [Pelobates cultripes]|uniref:Uncharacterized protein n=1 Tax=Pelobates cultripes TaxID=61616 RepID=A0AAD1WAV0_PELCU|nr:Hypothetical predicted protein [Pelobates cultripes]